jgi:hypothetical protein
MAGTKYVELKVVCKELFDKKLEKSLVDRATAIAKNQIDNKSGGALTTKTKSKEGFIVTLDLTIKADDKAAPTKLDGKLAITAISIGGTAKAFTGSSNGKVDGFGKKPENGANDLVDALVEDLMFKAVKTLKGL